VLQDHPLFREWEAALADMNKAWEAVSDAAVDGEPKELAAKEGMVIAAIQRFREISDQLEVQ
jgi:hypothetical protein